MALAGAVALPTIALAQDLLPGQTVLDRPRPELDPLGARFEGFYLYPAVTVEGMFDDNIFRTDNNEKEDYILNITPEMSVESDWANHSLNFFGNLNKQFYESHDEEEVMTWQLGTDGQLDIDRESFLTAALNHSKDKEDRGDPDAAQGEEPTRFYTSTADLGGETRFDRVRLNVDVGYTKLDYEDVPALATVINNDDRDRAIWDGSVQGTYEWDPQLGVYLRGEGNVRRYDNTPDDNDFDRDSQGWGVFVGAELDYGAVIFGDVYAGYRDQSYDDDNDLDSINGPAIGGNLFWNVTEITTASFFASRTVRESTLVENNDPASGYYALSGGARVDHELLRNLLLNAEAGARYYDYEGINRDDYIYDFGAGATYMMYRHVYFSGGYEFEHRDSDTRDADYTNHRVMVRARIQM